MKVNANIRHALRVSIAVAAAAAAGFVTLQGRTPQTSQVNIKVATLAPQGTPWYQIIQDMGEKWRKASGGKIALSIYPGGTLGDEAAMINAMRRGGPTQGIKVAAVTTIGLETIARECSALSIPLLFQSNEELDYVMDHIRPRLEKAIEDKGFVVLNWGDAGWVRIFTKKPAPTIGDLKQMTIFTSTGDPRTKALYEEAGFKAKQTPVSEVLTQLTTGALEAVPAPPLFAYANQWFGVARNMIDIRFGVLVGATIIRKDTWDLFEPSLRETLLKDAHAAGDRLKADIRKMDDDAIESMKKNARSPLNVIKLTPQAQKEWQETAEKFYAKIRGTIVEPAEFDEVMSLVKEFRAQKAQKK
jgi:TRAP-type C4-dicarboxylate transport system substrate-binding protein